jgi:hypothetical protein
VEEKKKKIRKEMARGEKRITAINVSEEFQPDSLFNE